MNTLPALISALAFCASLMTALWFVQLRTKNAGIVDIAWAAAVGLSGCFFAIAAGGDPGRRMLVAALIGAWSLRLSAYLYRRVIGEPEEGRYAAMREHFGRRINLFLFGFFQLQALAAFLFALPVWLVASNPAPLGTVGDVMGVGLWVLGMAGVSLADWQLARFRQRGDSAGRTCRDGLWRYSRHPNYFFEWIHWWAYVALAVGTAYWWAAAGTPLLLLIFILFITGIPPTERQALRSRGDDYREYQRTTSAFVPWFPKTDTQTSST